jgi:hypothetical protein
MRYCYYYCDLTHTHCAAVVQASVGAAAQEHRWSAAEWCIRVTADKCIPCLGKLQRSRQLRVTRRYIHSWIDWRISCGGDGAITPRDAIFYAMVMVQGQCSAIAAAYGKNYSILATAPLLL